MPFQGHLFVKAEVRAELNQICNNQDQIITSLWNKVYERFNNATKAKNFVKALSQANIKSDAALKILCYYDGVLSNITAQNAHAAVSSAEALRYQATTNIPGFFDALVGKTDNHRKGKYNPQFQGNEIKEGGVVRHRRYYNGQNYLPIEAPNTYIEWYVSNSPQKRFFTAYNKPDVWFTDGGTHQASDFWHNPDPAQSRTAWRRNFKAED